MTKISLNELNRIRHALENNNIKLDDVRILFKHLDAQEREIVLLRDEITAWEAEWRESKAAKSAST